MADYGVPPNPPYEDPVLVRRVLAGLRERGYVGSDKGLGGGWSITCDLRQVTLRDIYDP
jgi:DNA-binding IscR family transcriptional regulator